MLAGWYVYAYGDCTRQFFHLDDFWILRDASRISVHALRDVMQFAAPGRNGFLLYRPLSQVAYFWGLYQVFGADSAGYHAMQLAAHVVNALLVYAIAVRVFGARDTGLAAALVYAAAPGHAIAAYWVAVYGTITGVAFWYLACLYAWLRLPERWRGGVCLVLQVLGLLSGEHAVTLPVALTAAAVVDGRRSSPPRRAVRQLLPLYIVAGGYGVAKLAYVHAGLARDFPEPLARAFVLAHYEPSFGATSVVELLGFYVSCTLGWLYAASPRPSVLLAYGCGVLVAVVASGAWAARSAKGRVVLFGMLLFAVSLGPALLLPRHRFTYYVGIAAAGASLAMVAAVRAVPKVGRLLVIVLAVAVLAVEVRIASPKVSDNDEFRFYRAFQQGALSWLATVDEGARAADGVRQVVIPRNLLTAYVFEIGEGHRLFYSASYTVRLVDNVNAVAPEPGLLRLAEPDPWRQGAEFPGRSPRWDWLR